MHRRLLGFSSNTIFEMRFNEIHTNLFIGSIEGKTLSKGTSLINTTFD